MHAYNPVPKPQHKRFKPKRKQMSEFSAATRLIIIERDNGLCVRCGRLYDNIHHIQLRSRGGSGHHTNGCCVCVVCHKFAHSGQAGEDWFKKFQRERLLVA